MLAYVYASEFVYLAYIQERCLKHYEMIVYMRDSTSLAKLRSLHAAVGIWWTFGNESMLY